MDDPGHLITLNEDELKLIATVSKMKGVPLDETKRQFSKQDLESLGFVRENWGHEEVIEKGFGLEGVVTSFDENSVRAEKDLSVDVPFAVGVQKWQLPINLPNFRVIMTRFPPNTVVDLHEHPNFDGVSACGQLRVVVQGSITFDGRKYGPGDWFFIPNGVPYSFVTDPDLVTLENYYYQYNGATLPMRFSSPQASEAG
jgi:quercetin dioxygenase-like cupin family protein